MKVSDIPGIIVERLPRYYRYFDKSVRNNVDYISSKEIGEELGIHSTQVRKDFSYYGEFGKRGVGYETTFLRGQLEKILGLNYSWEIVLIGMGNLGEALVSYDGFKRLGLNIRYVFDVAPKLAESKLGDVEVYNIDNLDSILKKNEIKIGIIATPAEAAQDIVDKLVVA